MKRRFLVLFILIPLFIFSQDLPKGNILKSKAPIPLEFRTLSSSKYKIQAASIQSKDKAHIKRSKKQFLLESNFLIDKLLTSGKVLFNDPLSEYVTLVANKILEKDKSLKDSLKFYVVKSPVVNALSTNQGYIMVNMGLLAQVENEAQLAYILCHEIVHFKRKHSLNRYVKLEGRQGELRKKTYEEQLFTKSSYSKENETQADNEGLDLFLKSNYSADVLQGVFDVLEYGHLPYDEVDFVCKSYESEYFKFPKDYMLTDCQAITPNDGDDTLSTHPSIQKRRIQIKKRLNASGSGKQKYLVGESQFKKVQQLSRNELSRLYNENKNYGASLYNSFLLLKENPKNAFAKEQTLYALYFLTKNKNREIYKVSLLKLKKYRGNLRHFIIY